MHTITANAVAASAVCIIQFPEELKCYSVCSSLDIIEDLPLCLMSVSFNETFSAVYMAIGEAELHKNSSRREVRVAHSSVSTAGVEF